MNTRTKNPSAQLAVYLESAKSKAKGQVVKSSDLDRMVRERLTAAGYLSRVMKGWYLLSKPTGLATTTLWFSNFWDFIREYLSERFGQEYCLSPESSLDLHAGSHSFSRQVIVVTKKASNESIELPHKTSILLYQDEKNFPAIMVKKNGLNIIPLAEAICRSSPSYFLNSTLNMEICLKSLRSPAEISRALLESKSLSSANRIIGAFKCLNDHATGSQIEKDLLAAGFSTNPVNPFEEKKLFLSSGGRITSPYAARIKAMWTRMREDVLKVFPKDPGISNTKNTLSIIEHLYKEDSYHSLSIEGYHVTPKLIQNIQEGNWSPELNANDERQNDAFAAKGYFEASQQVRASVTKVLNGDPSGKVFYDDVQNWYRELFRPGVIAGVLEPTQLAGYRSKQVYIAGSRHIPPPPEAVLDSMNALERLLIEEPSAAIRAVLGHFIFVFIHPYMDGNGRIGRFILNLMLVSGGYNWTVIRVSERQKYMESLEAASVEGDIKPFADLVLNEMTHWRRETERILS